MESIINNPEMNRYHRSYEPGHIIFWEGDDTSELHILISGELNVLKGDKVIAHMDVPGTIFGEMSFLLGGKRTASVKTLSKTEVLAIPQKDLANLRKQYPDISEEITRLLAERLDHASQVVYGLRQFCDQLPDAVMLTDQEGRIISMNRAANNLYGHDFSQLHGQRLENIYEDPQSLLAYEDAAQAGKEVREKVLAINHPQKGRRWVSLSMNSLYDARNNFKGLLALGRDVTSSRNTKKRFQRTLLLVVPAMLLFGGYITLQALDISPWGPKSIQVEAQKHELETRLAKDFFMLKAQLLDYYDPIDQTATHAKLKKFIAMQDKKTVPYRAIILLDPDKRVFDAVTVKGNTDATNMIGSTYARLNFEGRSDSLHKVLSVYRREVGQPYSYRVLEIAFEVKRKGEILGWIVFQMDMDLLKRKKQLDEESLKNFKFQEP
jgi:CRP/FNR family cyclic AMP-dependent transcriptional regulator